MLKPTGGGLFRILGPVEAWSGDAWAEVSAAKERALLAILLLHPGQPVSTDRLIAELWGEQPPESALGSLRVYMHHLRRLIGDQQGSILVTRPPGYQAVLRPGDLDAERFASLLAEGRRALAGDPPLAADLLAQALECWRGPALVDARQAPLAAAEADRLDEVRIEARKLRAEADLACGRASEVVTEMQRLLMDHQLREEFWALLMRALQGAGRQAEALEAYDRARHVLADELGVDPGAELQQLYQQILNADHPAAPPAQAAVGPGPVVPLQLPADITDFTGRADQVMRVSELLSGEAGGGSPGAVRVVLIMGSGGLGKTTLAVHAAHQVAHLFPDGQLYANLHGASQPADPSEILARFLRDLGAEGSRIPAGEEERAAHLRTRLAGKRVLIVLDDARNASQVVPLLPGSASCAVLVTARGRLPELVGSKVIDLEVLSLDEARSLFTGMVGEQRALAEPDATGEVLTACAGLPLAIRIAGARLAARENWVVRTLANRLADERRRLDELRVGNLAVRTSFEVSFASLARSTGPEGVDPTRAFCLLGLWTGPSISLPAAAALLGAPGDAVAEALDVLVDAHLLESPGADLYRFHDLLRVYAADRARTQETEAGRHAALSRLLTWYLHTAEAAARVIAPQHTRVPLGQVPEAVHPLEFASLDQALTWCESARAGLMAATRLAAGSGLHEIAWKLPAASMSFYRRRSHWTDWITSHQAGLDSARILADRVAEAWMLNNLGIAYGQQRMEESVSCFEQALVICREIPDAAGETRAANNVAQACLDLGRFDEALTAAQRSLLTQRRAGNRYGEGLALNILGTACRALGRLDEAMSNLRLALGIFREVGSKNEEAESLRDLGETHLDQGQVEDAAGCLSAALDIRRAIGDRRGEAATLRGLSRAHLLAGDSRRAHALLSEALPLLEELGDRRQAAEVRLALAKILKSAS